jgi:hypothetical protein
MRWIDVLACSALLFAPIGFLVFITRFMLRALHCRRDMQPDSFDFVQELAADEVFHSLHPLARRAERNRKPAAQQTPSGLRRNENVIIWSLRHWWVFLLLLLMGRLAQLAITQRSAQVDWTYITRLVENMNVVSMGIGVLIACAVIGAIAARVAYSAV